MFNLRNHCYNRGMIYSLTLLLAATSASPNVTCVKLNADFIENERFFSFMYHSRKRLYEAALATYNAVAPAEHELRRLEAVSGSTRTLEPRKRLDDDLEKARQALADVNTEYLANGDRITTLLIANRCRPPDHVTSPDTYPPAP